MEWFFAKDYTGNPFVLFGPAHLAFLAGAILFYLTFPLIRNKSERWRRNYRIVYVIVSITNELSWHIWKASIGEWTVQEMLPLHLCSVFVVLNAIMLLTGNRTIYEISYFLAIGGAMQALLTPDAGQYGLPHIRAWQTLIAHTLIMGAPIYMTVVEGYRPYWASLKRVFISANIYMVVITILNFIIGSNYMFTAHKPVTASLIDMLGPWPWYLLSLEVVALAVCVILYLPFAIKDWLARRRPAPAS